MVLYSSSWSFTSIPSILLLNPPTELTFGYFFTFKISIWFFTSSLVLLRTMFSFVLSMFVIALWSIFMLAALQFLSDNSNSYIKAGTYSLSISNLRSSLFLVWFMILIWNLGLLCIMRLRILFRSSVWVGLLWHHSGKKDEVYLFHLTKAEVLKPAFI